MTTKPVIPDIRLEEAALPAGRRSGTQQALRSIYQPAHDLPDDLRRLIDRLR